MANPPDNKISWLKLLKQTSIPSFNASIQALSNVEEYSSSHSSELARTILKDPNLTASVLKLANSAHFNRHGQAVKTISRSIMVLGHKSIKEVCASCLLMEQFMKNGASKTIMALLARSFHAAIQAKEIALLKGQKGTEEIFISALLLSLGETSVYSAIESTSPLALELDKNYPLAAGKEKDIIGCYFNDLTLGLCQAWNIAPMIGEMLAGKYSEGSPVRSILLANGLASSCEKYGIERAIQMHLKSLTLYTGKSPEQISEKIVEATKETQKSLSQFGIEFDVKLAKHPSNSVTLQQEITTDKLLQLDIIHELSVAVQQKTDINFVLQSLLEGIQRGGGFQSSLVSLLNPAKTRIHVKHAIEQKGCNIKENFNFNCDLDIPEVKQKVMNNKNIVLQTELRPQGATLAQILKRTGSKNAIWGPLVVEGKTIGCIYACNGSNGPAVTAGQVEAFQLFVYQAGLLLYKLKK